MTAWTGAYVRRDGRGWICRECKRLRERRAIRCKNEPKEVADMNGEGR